MRLYRGPTAPAESAVSLREYVESRLHEIDLRGQQRFDAQTKAVDAAIIAQRTAIDAALIAADKATALFAQTAKDKFETVNEFRGTLTDQAATFVTRIEMESAAQRNTDRIADLSLRVPLLVTRKELDALVTASDSRLAEISRQMLTMANRDLVMAEYDRMSSRLQELGDRVTRSEGQGSGAKASTDNARTLIIAVVTIIISLAVLGIGLYAALKT